jgi:hypothetical protein
MEAGFFLCGRGEAGGEIVVHCKMMHLRARRTSLFLACAALVAGAALAGIASGCGPAPGTYVRADAIPENDATPVQDSAAEGAPTEASSDAGVVVPPVSPPVLVDYPNCPLTMFVAGTTPQDFSSQAAVLMAWNPQWVAPLAVAGGALQFGPHPMSESWWENYSPITSSFKPGDVLSCARLRISREPGSADSNTFELTMRLPDEAGFETSGMALEINASTGMVQLHTRLTADTWITHDKKPLTLASGTATLDLLLQGQGAQFAAEVRDVDTGTTVRLQAVYPLPPGGAISMVGWRNRQPWFVDRLVVGIPAANVAERLAQ